MKELLELLLSRYRRKSHRVFICYFILDMKLDDDRKYHLSQFIKSKLDGKEAKQIAEKYDVELQVKPEVFGLFVDAYLDKKKKKKLRIEWLKLLIENEL